jgi:hypothetical protein
MVCGPHRGCQSEGWGATLSGLESRWPWVAQKGRHDYTRNKETQARFHGGLAAPTQRGIFELWAAPTTPARCGGIRNIATTKNIQTCSVI